ncbi:hypothetical protein Godav_017484 [Gossypium davidsonii]|uniref:RNase H type-1 domain-containing protein n=1 Tax=Gossypium davidsonii TaxID=34287 RepID=A0A7J8QUC1_GOSDV|nr:hypothetical protein [Gossypium davidsonii]
MRKLIGRVFLGSSCGVFGRIATCLFFKAFRGALMKSLKSHIAGQNNIPQADGSVKIYECFVADGGLVQDLNGEWIIGFSRYLGNCTVMEMELWGILDGIKAINAIIDGSSGNSNFALVRRIHHTLKKVKQWEIEHIPREENSIANMHAKTVLHRRLGLRLFEDPTLRI